MGADIRWIDNVVEGCSTLGGLDLDRLFDARKIGEDEEVFLFDYSFVKLFGLRL